MIRLMVFVALMAGAVYVVMRYDLIRPIAYLYEKRNWQRISLDRDKIAMLAELDVDGEYDLLIRGHDLSIADIEQVKRLRGVKALSLIAYSQLDGGFLRSLASFESIQSLWLVDVPMDDQTMEAIRDMTSLRSLNLRSNDEGRQLSNLELLLPLAKVETFGLNGWRLTADNARVVGSIANLRVLRLYADGVADGG